MNISKTQGEWEFKLKIDQIKVKIDELTVKKYKVKIVQIWTDLKVSNQNSLTQMADLTEES